MELCFSLGIRPGVGLLGHMSTITALNAKVDVDKEEYEDVAEEYWESIRQQ